MFYHPRAKSLSLIIGPAYAMKLADLFPDNHVFLGVRAANREELFGFLSERAGELGLVNTRLCATALGVREELGSTGLGSGIAIPHARIANLDHTVGLLATLARPIDFEAVDQEPVDIVLMLLMPDQSGGDQIKVLSRIARMARDEPTMNALRRAGSVDDVAGILQDADEGL